MEEPLFERLARECGITVKEMRKIILARKRAGMTMTRRNGHDGGRFSVLWMFRRQKNGCVMR